MRRWMAIIGLAVLVVAAFWVTSYFLRGPHYALYQIGKGIHDRDPQLFLAYVDIDSILQGQRQTIVDLVYPKGRGDEKTRNMVQGLVTAFMGPLSDQVRLKIIKVINDPERNNIPSSWTLVAGSDIATNGDYAMVLMEDPFSDKRLRVGMRKGKDGVWRVVDLNSNDLKLLASEYLEKEHGVKVEVEEQGQPSGQ